MTLHVAKNISKFSKNECDALFKQGVALLRSQFLTVIAIPQQGTFGRSLIVTSRRVGHAHERNLLRRRIKAILYEEKLFTFGCDTAIILKKPATTLSFDALKTLIMDAFTLWQKRQEQNIPTP